jgi:hypothetical protein
MDNTISSYSLKTVLFNPRADGYKNYTISMDSHSLISSSLLENLSFDEVISQIENGIKLTDSFQTVITIEQTAPVGVFRKVQFSNECGKYNVFYQRPSTLPENLIKKEKKENDSFFTKIFRNLFADSSPIQKMKKEHRNEEFDDKKKLIESIINFML